MGIFDIFKRKTEQQKKQEKFELLRKKGIVQERKSIMQEMIVSDNHDDSSLDENPNGKGEYGLEKTNPIPVNGIDNVPAYMDKLRYEYTSTSGSGIKTYNPITFQRTNDIDDSPVGTQKGIEGNASATSAQNIQGYIDVYNLYSVGGAKLAKIYINSYSLKTSNKIPRGFFHRDEISVMQDGKVMMELLKNI